MNEEKIQTFFKMVTEISEDFGSGDELFYVVDKEKKLALEAAKKIVEKHLADRQKDNRSDSAARSSLDRLVSKFSREKRAKSKNADPCTFNEMESKSGSREWVNGEGGSGINSEDIFQCGGKTPYKTLQDAEKGAAKYSQFKGEKFRAYVCTYCRSYHFGRDG